MMEVSRRTLSVAVINPLAAFRDDALQFVSFLARGRPGGTVEDGTSLLIVGVAAEALDGIGAGGGCDGRDHLGCVTIS